MKLNLTSLRLVLSATYLHTNYFNFKHSDMFQHTVLLKTSSKNKMMSKNNFITTEAQTITICTALSHTYERTL
jgi:hypothetical protein